MSGTIQVDGIKQGQTIEQPTVTVHDAVAAIEKLSIPEIERQLVRDRIREHFPDWSEKIETATDFLNAIRDSLEGRVRSDTIIAIWKAIEALFS